MTLAHTIKHYALTYILIRLNDPCETGNTTECDGIVEYAFLQDLLVL